MNANHWSILRRTARERDGRAAHCRPRLGRPTARGFTLMEVLLVLVILVILASLAVSTYRGVQNRALKDAAKTKVGILAGQIDTYQLHMRNFPTALRDLLDK